MNFRIFRTFVLAVCLAATGLAAQTTVVASGSAPTPTPTPTPTIDSTWWKHAVIYEIYPRSFQDSNGDGIGDLNGITERLDYLQALGVDAIWISPMYPSPQVDFGYDISDYENVDPQYGTLKDFDRLVAEAKKRNIRVILDMVLNHTSDKHKWLSNRRVRGRMRSGTGTCGMTGNRAEWQAGAAEQLGEFVWRVGVGVYAADEGVLLSQVL